MSRKFDISRSHIRALHSVKERVAVPLREDPAFLKQLKWLKRPEVARGMVLASFLNEAPQSSSARLVRILELRHAAEKESSNDLPEIDIYASGGVEGLTVSDWPGFELTRQANKLLKPYKPPPLRLDTPIKSNPRFNSGPQYATSEDEAAHAFVLLAEASCLYLLRKCPGCEKWFFAKRKNQEHCHGNCRSKKAAKTDHFKIRRSLYLKVRYWKDQKDDLQYRLNDLPKTASNQKRRDELTAKLGVARQKFKAKNQELQELKKGQERTA